LVWNGNVGLVEQHAWGDGRRSCGAMRWTACWVNETVCMAAGIVEPAHVGPGLCIRLARRDAEATDVMKCLQWLELRHMQYEYRDGYK
jgi:hypothetical protein